MNDIIDYRVTVAPRADAAESWEDFSREETLVHLYKSACNMENLYPVHRSGIDCSTYAGIKAAEAIVSDKREIFISQTRSDIAGSWNPVVNLN